MIADPPSDAGGVKATVNLFADPVIEVIVGALGVPNEYRRITIPVPPAPPLVVYPLLPPPPVFAPPAEPAPVLVAFAPPPKPPTPVQFAFVP